MQREQVDPVWSEKESNVGTQEGTQDITEETFIEKEETFVEKEWAIPQVDLHREGEREETFIEKEETFVEKGNEKSAKVGLCPSVEFWIL